MLETTTFRSKGSLDLDVASAAFAMASFAAGSCTRRTERGEPYAGCTATSHKATRIRRSGRVWAHCISMLPLHLASVSQLGEHDCVNMTVIQLEGHLLGLHYMTSVLHFKLHVCSG